jgi:hypothetical protein
MALAEHGIALNPSELNRQLKANDGYTERGWIKWDAVEKISSGKVRIDSPSQPTNQTIDSALSAGFPVIVKFMLRPEVYHWVLLVGSDKEGYLMKDPLGDGTKIDSFASLNREILSVRIVGKL